MDTVVERTKGDLITKLYAVVDGLGNPDPVIFVLSAGNDHNSIHAIELLDKVEISDSRISTRYDKIIKSFYMQIKANEFCEFAHL